MTQLTSIIKATIKDVELLADIGRVSFMETHGHSASENDVNKYVRSRYNPDVIRKELNDPENIYYIIYYGDQAAGYSKIILNAPNPNIQLEHITKLERLYLLEEFHGLKLGLDLFNYNMKLSIQNNQKGMWLFVWKENQRAIRFYKKSGFEIIGSHDFKLSETHSNPNHHMLLRY